MYFVNVTTGGFGLTIKQDFGSSHYLCGLLNSRLLDLMFKCSSAHFQGGYYGANKQYIEQLPIRPIDFSDPADKARHDKMVRLVEGMLELNKKLQAARVPDEKTMIKRQIDATDRQIDMLVYELYGLTDDEIAIVEDATGKK